MAASYFGIVLFIDFNLKKNRGRRNFEIDIHKNHIIRAFKVCPVIRKQSKHSVPFFEENLFSFPQKKSFLFRTMDIFFHLYTQKFIFRTVCWWGLHRVSAVLILYPRTPVGLQAVFALVWANILTALYAAVFKPIRPDPYCRLTFLEK
jgi:hypothetical protein